LEDDFLNERIRRLRERSIQAVPFISAERALLVTEFYQSGVARNVSEPVRRALAFQYILEHKSIFIDNDELIVGERGPAPKAVPTWPELTIHSIEDLNILHSRKKIPFKVSTETKKVYEETIIPFWQGRTIRERIFQGMSDDWKAAYSAGVFTEFMEQRAPGHTVLDDKIYRKGMRDFKKEIQQSIANLDFLGDPEAYHKREELRAMDIAASALISFAKRYADQAAEMARKEKKGFRKSELERIAEICVRVPASAPRNFWEALQYYWFVHLGVITELNPWDAFNPGKLDQHLYPFYKKDTEDGILNSEQAKELLQAFWIKFNNQPAPPKVGVTAEESCTYTDFAQINLGSVKSDGSDAVNELSYLILDVIDEMRLIQPNPSVHISKKTPEQFVKHALKVVREGFGQPALFNADVVVQEMIRQGKSVEDARNGGTSGCVETGAFGKENYNLTGYFNLPKVLEITLHNGVDPNSGEKIGIETGNPSRFQTFDEFMDAFQKQLRHFVDIKVKGNNIIERMYADHMPVPFLSLLIDDCILRGKDYHNGGARYNTSYIQGVGLGTTTDAAAAIKYHVFDKKTFTMAEFVKILDRDFEGYEKVRDLLLHRTPKYGNDDDYADEIMQRLFHVYFDAIDGRPNTKGGHYRINLLPTTVHIYFGSRVNATPDGRKAGEPLSEGVSPVQGADRKGPTAVMKSVSKMDHVRTGGTLLNMKFSPQVIQGEEGLGKFAHLVRSYFKMDGHHVQFNVVNAETLREAQQQPEKFRNLIVRVAGYSDYFVDLGKDLQDEIIKRTEFKEM